MEVDKLTPAENDESTRFHPRGPDRLHSLQSAC